MALTTLHDRRGSSRIRERLMTGGGNIRSPYTMDVRRQQRTAAVGCLHPRGLPAGWLVGYRSANDSVLVRCKSATDSAERLPRLLLLQLLSLQRRQYCYSC